MSTLPIPEFDATALDTPTGQHHVVVALSRTPQQPDTLRVEISFSADEVAERTMHVHTLHTALANPGRLIDDGHITVMADLTYSMVIMYLPTGNGDYAVLYLDMQVAQSFVDNATVEVTTELALAEAADTAAERAVDELAAEGVADLEEWLSRIRPV